MPSVFWLWCLPCQWPFPAVSWEADGGQRSSRSPGSCPGLHLKCHVSGPALSDQLGSRLSNHDPALLRCPTLVMLGKNLRSSWVTASMTKWRRWSSSKKTGSLFWCLHWISHRSAGEVAWFEMLDAHLGHWAARAGWALEWYRSSRGQRDGSCGAFGGHWGGNRNTQGQGQGQQGGSRNSRGLQPVGYT